MRTLVSVLLATVVTAGLLFMMSLLIKDEKLEVKEEQKRVAIDSVSVPKDKPKKVPDEIKPPKPPAIERTPEPSGQVIETAEIDSTQDEWTAIGPDVEVNLLPGFGEVPSMTFTQESDALPMYRTQPNYPMIAQQRGLEGWVLLKYDVDTSGALSNIDVLDSEPRRIFDKEAVRALKKWKFKPAMTNGQPIASLGQTVKIEFNIDQE